NYRENWLGYEESRWTHLNAPWRRKPLKLIQYFVSTVNEFQEALRLWTSSISGDRAFPGSDYDDLSLRSHNGLLSEMAAHKVDFLSFVLTQPPAVSVLRRIWEARNDGFCNEC